MNNLYIKSQDINKNIIVGPEEHHKYTIYLKIKQDNYRKYEYIHCQKPHELEGERIVSISIDGYNLDEILYSLANVKLDENDLNAPGEWSIKPNPQILGHFKDVLNEK